MDKQDKQLDEQDHPLKNTDQAFVQVGKNGEPVIPKQEGEEKSDGRSDKDQPDIRHH